MYEKSGMSQCLRKISVTFFKGPKRSQTRRIFFKHAADLIKND